MGLFNFIGETFEELLQIVKEISKTVYRCTICGKMFSTFEEAQRHVNNHRK